MPGADEVSLAETTATEALVDQKPVEKLQEKPAEKKPAEKPKEPEYKEESIFAKMPPVTPLPRPGNPLLAPTTPGFYSLEDHICGQFSEKPPKSPSPRFSITPPSFFDYDWRYLDKPDNQEHDCFDCLKRIPLGSSLLFTTGGEVRMRYNMENSSRLTGRDNTYELLRTRVYGDLSFLDCFRVYAEFIDAHSFSENLAPLPIDVDRSDILNLFAELKLGDVCGAPVWLRTGRQELLYGSQRLISTLDWANTRRTFQGVKAYRHGEKLDVDAFCVQPVIPDPSNPDSVDNNQVFSGVWTTWKPTKSQKIDAYYLNLDNTNVQTTLGIPRGQFNVHTIGSRYFGQCEDGWMADAEGAVQLGSKRGESISAYSVTGGVGYQAKDCAWNPQVWLYYDHASGDDSPAARDNFHTFNQLFPFGHYYFGFIDVVGRQNIHDLNVQVAAYPTNWITTFAQFHVFRLDKARDALYNAGGVPIRRDATGRAGTDVGQELDLVVNFHLTKHADILINYSHLFSGDFIKQTGNPRDADYLYLQYSYRW